MTEWLEPILRARLASGKATAETEERIVRLLYDLGERRLGIDSEELFHLRAVHALERIGTKQARQVLKELADGAQISPRTRAAVDALRWLDLNDKVIP